MQGVRALRARVAEVQTTIPFSQLQDQRQIEAVRVVERRRVQAGAEDWIDGFKGNGQTSKRKKRLHKAHGNASRFCGQLSNFAIGEQWFTATPNQPSCEDQCKARDQAGSGCQDPLSSLSDNANAERLDSKQCRHVDDRATKAGGRKQFWRRMHETHTASSAARRSSVVEGATAQSGKNAEGEEVDMQHSAEGTLVHVLTGAWTKTAATSLNSNLTLPSLMQAATKEHLTRIVRLWQMRRGATEKSRCKVSAAIGTRICPIRRQSEEALEEQLQAFEEAFDVRERARRRCDQLQELLADEQSALSSMSSEYSQMLAAAEGFAASKQQLERKRRDASHEIAALKIEANGHEDSQQEKEPEVSLVEAPAGVSTEMQRKKEQRASERQGAEARLREAQQAEKDALAGKREAEAARKNVWMTETSLRVEMRQTVCTELIMEHAREAAALQNELDRLLLNLDMAKELAHAKRKESAHAKTTKEEAAKTEDEDGEGEAEAQAGEMDTPSDLEAEEQETVQPNKTPATPLFLDDLLLDTGLDDDQRQVSEERLHEDHEGSRRQQQRVQEEKKRIQTLMASHMHELLQLFVYYSNVQAIREHLQQDAAAAAASVLEHEPILSREAFECMAGGCRLLHNQGQESLGEPEANEAQGRPASAAAAARSAARGASPVSNKPAFGSSFESGGERGGRPIFYGRKVWDSGDNGSARKVGRIQEALSGELAVATCYDGQLLELQRQAKRDLIRRRQALESAPEPRTPQLDTSSLLFQSLPESSVKQFLPHASQRSPLMFSQDEVSAAIDSEFHDVKDVPVSKAVEVLLRFGCRNIRMSATVARNPDTNVRNVESKEEASKQTTVMPEALTERGLLEQVYGLQGRLYEQANVDGVRHEIRVSKLDLMEVFKAQHSQVRAEEQARGAWIMGRRLRTQVMQKHSFMSALVRLSLAYVVSNHIPLLTAFPVSEAFRYCLHNHFLPRTLSKPSMVFVGKHLQPRRLATLSAQRQTASAGKAASSTTLQRPLAAAFGDAAAEQDLDAKSTRARSRRSKSDHEGKRKGGVRSRAREDGQRGKKISGKIQSARLERLADSDPVHCAFDVAGPPSHSRPNHGCKLLDSHRQQIMHQNGKMSEVTACNVKVVSSDPSPPVAKRRSWMRNTEGEANRGRESQSTWTCPQPFQAWSVSTTHIKADTAPSDAASQQHQTRNGSTDANPGACADPFDHFLLEASSSTLPSEPAADLQATGKVGFANFI